MIVARKSWITSLAFAVVLAGTLAALALPRIAGWRLAVGYALWFGGVATAGFLMLSTGRTSRWRAMVFIALAWAFVLHFKAFLFGLGQSRLFSPEIQEVPYCHIAIASSFLNTLHQQFLALRSGAWPAWGPLGFGALCWLALTLAIGQAWCSWGCFYGGLDEGFSRLLRRPLWRRFQLPARWRDLPAAILLFSLLASLTALLPIFCLWMCPLKVTTAFLDTYGPTRLLQIIFFSAIGVAALVVLPLVLKRRVFCGLLCPFGAWQSFFGRVNPFRVTLSTEICTQCRQCLSACPTFVLDDDTLRTGTISAYCNRCGECIDECNTGAMAYTLLGKPLRSHAPSSNPKEHGAIAQHILELWDARVIFLFAALVMTGAVGSLFVPSVIVRLLVW